MTDRERALDYIAIFVNVGDDWRKFVPLDGELLDNGLRIGTCELWPATGGVWMLDDGESRTAYAKAASS
jgi:hypothetical protein